MARDPEANRHVTRRDGRREGEPNVDEDADLGEEAMAFQETQRDLTSLSGPPLRLKPRVEDH